MSISETKYLLAIYRLGEEGNPVRSVDISRLVGVSRSSVVKMLRVLAEAGLAIKPHYGSVLLTPRGIWEANQAYTRCALLSSYFSGCLGLDQETAQNDAICALCTLSEQSIELFIREALMREGKLSPCSSPGHTAWLEA